MVVRNLCLYETTSDSGNICLEETTERSGFCKKIIISLGILVHFFVL
jgi:hypothetical protein